jgi:outer membrane protein
MSLRSAAALGALVLIAFPCATLANSPPPIAVPTPMPEVIPSQSPLPYPAYGAPAPDVQVLVPHPGIPTRVSISQAIDLAVAISPTFASERAAYSELRAKYSAEQQALFPAISANGSWQESYGGVNSSNFGATGAGQSGAGRGTYGTASVGYTISQLIFDGGRVIAAIKAAKESEISGRGTLLRQLDTLAYDVAGDYYTVLEDQATVDADRQLVREFTTAEDAVRAQIRNGVAALSALASAEYQTAKARGQLVSAQGAVIGAQSTFSTLIGVDANTEIVPQPLGPDTYTASPTYAKSLAQALLLRPDYLAAQASVEADADNLRYAELARVPTITASWSQGASRTIPGFPITNSTGTVIGNTGNWSQNRTLGAQISIPIYDQGLTWYNIEVAKYTLDQANASLAGTKLLVESDVRSGLADLISARATFAQARLELSSAQVSMQAAQAQYKVGVNTILDLITAEANLATAQSDYISALYGVRLAEQTYLYATGLSDLRL